VRDLLLRQFAGIPGRGIWTEKGTLGLNANKSYSPIFIGGLNLLISAFH